MKKLKIYWLIFIFIFTSSFMFSNDGGFKISPYPDGKHFAFTVTDDPDHSKIQKVKTMYGFLDEIGLKTTVAVWVKECSRANGEPDTEGRFDYGATLQNEEYRNYILSLRNKGFEIALHTVSGCNDLRKGTIDGYEQFRSIFGEYPKMNIMHSMNLDNVYWGAKVFKSKAAQWFFKNVVGMVYPKASFSFGGEDPQSRYYWADILKEKTKYVRLWGTSDINTLKFNPSMPYHDPDRPEINYWFSFSDGHNMEAFLQLISDKNIEKLVRERGASIVYTHFAAGFIKRAGDNSYAVDEQVKKQLIKIAQQKDGWFVPASTLLDRLQAIKNVSLIDKGRALIVVNSNPFPVEGMTLAAPQGAVLYDNEHKKITVNDEGEILIGTLKANESSTLYKSADSYSINNISPGYLEQWKLLISRALVWFYAN
ncbi:MAG: hypothetical protein HY808_01760 [Nitrospirae bacterium]|nr:hypothetical protein [Nitrospirota bacterium]